MWVPDYELSLDQLLIQDYESMFCKQTNITENQSQHITPQPNREKLGAGDEADRGRSGSELRGSRVQERWTSNSWARERGSDAVASSSAGSCIHSWYRGTCSRRYGTSTARSPTAYQLPFRPIPSSPSTAAAAAASITVFRLRPTSPRDRGQNRPAAWKAHTYFVSTAYSTFT